MCEDTAQAGSMVSSVKRELQRVLATGICFIRLYAPHRSQGGCISFEAKSII